MNKVDVVITCQGSIDHCTFSVNMPIALPAEFHEKICVLFENKVEEFLREVENADFVQEICFLKERSKNAGRIHENKLP